MLRWSTKGLDEVAPSTANSFDVAEDPFAVPRSVCSAQNLQVSADIGEVPTRKKPVEDSAGSWLVRVGSEDNREAVKVLMPVNKSFNLLLKF